MGLRQLKIFQFFQCGDHLYTSESDVYRRQILKYKDNPRTERFKMVRNVLIQIVQMQQNFHPLGVVGSGS